MRNDVFLEDRSAAADAADLIALLGEHAAGEAALRAHRSRTLGNVIHYCRWREVERMIVLLGERSADGTIH